MFEQSEEDLAVAAQSGDRFRVAPLHGRHVLLRPVSPEDYRFLRSADLGGELGVRWRYRGQTASPEQWAQNLWQSVLGKATWQFIGEGPDRETGVIKVPGCGHDLADKSLMQSEATRILIDQVTGGGSR
jgi:hypothetical protein